jgi:hypothetical protein
MGKVTMQRLRLSLTTHYSAEIARRLTVKDDLAMTWRHMLDGYLHAASTVEQASLAPRCHRDFPLDQSCYHQHILGNCRSSQDHENACRMSVKENGQSYAGSCSTDNNMSICRFDSGTGSSEADSNDEDEMERLE